MTQTSKICSDLQTIIDGSIMMGTTPWPLILAKQLLEKQELELKLLTLTDLYTAGRRDGREAAFATGLTGDNDD